MPFKRKNSSVVHGFSPLVLPACGVTLSTKDFARAFDSETVTSATEMLFVDEQKKKERGTYMIHQSSSANHMVLIITDYTMTHVTVGRWFERLNCFSRKLKIWRF